MVYFFHNMVESNLQAPTDNKETSHCLLLIRSIKMELLEGKKVMQHNYYLYLLNSIDITHPLCLA